MSEKMDLGHSVIPEKKDSLANRHRPDKDEPSSGDHEKRRPLSHTSKGHTHIRHSQTEKDPRYELVADRFRRRKIPLQLMDYALGIKSLPSEQGRNETEAGIGSLLDEYSDKIKGALESAYGRHIETLSAEHKAHNADYAEKWKRIGDDWLSKNKKREVHPSVVIPVDTDRYSDPKDIGKMPPEIPDCGPVEY
jgi:hypothetical protein